MDTSRDIPQDNTKLKLYSYIAKQNKKHEHEEIRYFKNSNLISDNSYKGRIEPANNYRDKISKYQESINLKQTFKKDIRSRYKDKSIGHNIYQINNYNKSNYNWSTLYNKNTTVNMSSSLPSHNQIDVQNMPKHTEEPTFYKSKHKPYETYKVFNNSILLLSTTFHAL